MHLVLYVSRAENNEKTHVWLRNTTSAERLPKEAIIIGRLTRIYPKFHFKARISHQVCAMAPISHFRPEFLSEFALWREFLTFQSNFSIWSRASMAKGDLPARSSPAGHANNMVLTMSLGAPAWWWAGRRGPHARSVPPWSSENFKRSIVRNWGIMQS